MIERLEDRTLLSLLPPPIIPYSGHQNLTGGAASHNTPAVAVDPVDPSKVVAVYQISDPNDLRFVYLEGMYSAKYGKPGTWSLLPLAPTLFGNLIDPKDPNDNPFTQATDASVGFDRNENVYVVHSEHNRLASPPSDMSQEAIVLEKFNFKSFAPVHVDLPNRIGVPQPTNGQSVLYEGVVDLAVTPMMAVDTNLASFTDPVTGAMQKDPYAGNIYVAWSTQDIPGSGNPFSNNIKVLTSADGGVTFTTQTYVSSGFLGRPRLAISQGTADGHGPTPGQVTIVYDDFPPPAGLPTGSIDAALIQDGGYGGFGAAYPVPPLAVKEAEGGNTLMFNTAASTPFQQGMTVVPFTPNVGTDTKILKVTVKLNLTLNAPNSKIANLQAVVIAPDGTRVQLFGFGLPDPAVGVAQMINTVFDDAAGQNITTGMSPFTGTFTTDPAGGLAAFNKPGLGGQWTLQITDRDGNTSGFVNRCMLMIEYANLPHFTPSFIQLTDANFPNIAASLKTSDLDVTLNLLHGDLTEVSLQLVRFKAGYDPRTDPSFNVDAPSTYMSHVDDQIFLLQNRVDDMGMSNDLVGTSGANLGTTPSGVPLGTVFDDEAPRSIHDATDNATAPFTGHFRPDGGVLAKYKNKTTADLKRVWMLRIGDWVHQDSPPPQALLNWSMNFTFNLHPTPIGFAVPFLPQFVPSPVFKGALVPPYPYKVDALPPEVGLGPSPSLATDNTLGSFDPYEGRLYLTYVGANINQPPQRDNAQIFLTFSDDGGFSWSLPTQVNDDNGLKDGFSGADPVFDLNGRLQFQPEVAVDQYTGTLVISWYDARYDASRTRVARMLTTSLDGGATFGPQVYLNKPNRVQDVITREFVDLGPIPDNQGTGNTAARDLVYGFGDRQGLTVAAGHVYAVWAGNENGGPFFGDNRADRLGILTAVVSIAGGPRVISSTMGPVTAESTIGGITFNNTFDANHVRQLDGFVVSFDRPMDIRTFTPADVTVIYRNPDTTGFDPGESILVTQIVPIVRAGVATDFLVRIAPQSRTGTYSYIIRSNHVLQLDGLRDLIRTVDKLSAVYPGGIRTGNLMDQDGDAYTSDSDLTPTDSYAAPAPAKNSRFNGAQKPPFNPLGYFTPPYTQDSLPLILPGPHVVKTFVPGQPLTNDNLVLNGAVSFIDVMFDRNMDPATFAADARDILRFMGPAGSIKGPFSVAVAPASDRQAGEDPAHPRTFRISFPKQELSGTYTLVIDPNVRSMSGEPMDANLNAGVDKLRGVPPAGQGTPLIVRNTTPQIIGSSRTITSTITVTDDFVIQYLTLTLRIVFPNDPDLEATLIAPDGTRVALFAHLPPVFGPPFDANFNDTGFDDFAASLISQPQFPVRGYAPYQGEYRPQSPLRALVGKHSKGTWSLEIKNDGLNLGAFNNWSLTFQQTVPVSTQSANVPLQIPAANPPDQPQTTITSILTVTDDFLIQGATLSLNITYAKDSDLEASLIAPDGTEILLFSKLAAGTGEQADFADTVFDDQAVKPIQQGGPPYFGRFQPQLPLSQLNGRPSAGLYTLKIKNNGTKTGTLNAWSLLMKKPIPVNGLGELVADQTSTTFRIFTTVGDNPLSHSEWTPVGPAANFDAASGQHHSGRIGGLAVDPSDPTGNTVYVGGASGGIWKTTNFLTADPNGPTYIPLTDFGPTFGMNIGGIAVFPRNNDPNQSIIFAATGEGDVGGFETTHLSGGVGFLRSMDGGATWTLLDSTVNVDSNGNLLPLDSPKRDHIFSKNCGTTKPTYSFKIVVDPKARINGEVIVYAALGGDQPGIWRSLDTGKTWTNTTAGIPELAGADATDVLLDPNSGRLRADENPTGNLQIVYAAFRGSGVWISPETQGTSWNKLLGLEGDPLIQDGDLGGAIPVTAPSDTPTGKGRIVLAKPELTGKPLQDLLYEGWLYAVAETNGALNGLYLTKDYGRNWTKVRIPFVRIPVKVDVPTNDTTKTDSNVLGDQGAYDVSVGVDPTNPNIVYVGGMAPRGFIRVDTTGVSDPYAFYIANDRVDGDPGPGKMRTRTTDPTTLKNWYDSPTPLIGRFIDPMFNPYINLIQNPNFPFVANSTILVSNTLNFANSGAGARWTPLLDALEGTGDQHRLITFKDPLTGHARLIWGDDQGVFSAVDRGDGTLTTGIGTAPAPAPGSRNGNLQITQFYYGASQPSNLAAQVAVLFNALHPGLFYGQAQDNGSVNSDASVLNNGNLVWLGPAGDGAGIAADQTGSGTVFRYNWPCCGGGGTNFFQVNGTGRTTGLDPFNERPPQWPDVGGFNIAVNPLKGDELGGQALVSSNVGRIYETTTSGRAWFLIGNPFDTSSGLDQSNSHALAFGAPDPKGPNGGGSLKDFIYAGNDAGHIFVTFTGGGTSGRGNEWKNISNGLDGSSVRQIVTNPTRGSHEAYAVTFGTVDGQGRLHAVYHLADSQKYDPNDRTTWWQDITGNLDRVTHNVFNPFNETGQAPLTEAQFSCGYLETIQADWRYVIPDDSGQILNPVPGLRPSHPVLYIGGESGVYRSLDNGKTWSLFPSTTIDGAKQEGGYLPNAHVTQLNLAVGNITTTTGQPTVSGSPDVLLATTYGRGSFAIRVAPILIPGSLRLDPDLPKPAGSNPSKNNTTSVLQVVIDGLTEQSAFGNNVKIRLYEKLQDGTRVPIGVDVNNPAQAFALTDEQGRFKIQVKAGYFKTDGSTDGIKTLVLTVTDDAGSVGAEATFNYKLDTTPFIHAEAIKLDPNRPGLAGGSDSGLRFPFPGAAGTFTDGLTNVADPWIAGFLDQAGPTTIRLFDVTDAANPRLVGSDTSLADGTFSVHVTPGTFTTDGVKLISIEAVHLPNGNRIPSPFSFTLRTVPPALPPAPQLAPTSDTGFSSTDHITRDNMPTFTGTGEPGTQVQLYYVGNPTPIGLGFVNTSGTYTVTVGPNALPDGIYIIYVKLSDLAGNESSTSVALQPFLQIKTSPPGKPTIRLDPAYETTPGVTFSIPQLFDGTADPGTQVVIKDNGQAVDSFQQPAGSTTFSRTLSLSEGVHVVTVESTEVAGNVAVSDDLIVTINKDTLDADRKFIRQVYFNALGRLGSLPEWNIWMQFIAQANGRTIIANAIERSLEARDHMVKGWYETYLGRTAQNGEELGWANAMVRGMRPEQVLSIILGSQEYFNHAPLVPGVGGTPSDATFVTALYGQLLNRVPAPPEVNFWVGQVPRLGRAGVAFGFLLSPEYRSGVVQSYYSTVLRRATAPTPPEVAGWVNSGLDITAIRIAFESSPEFFFRTTGFQP